MAESGGVCWERPRSFLLALSKSDVSWGVVWFFLSRGARTPDISLLTLETQIRVFVSSRKEGRFVSPLLTKTFDGGFKGFFLGGEGPPA